MAKVSYDQIGKALVAQARRSPALFADLLTASTGRKCHPHPVHRLTQRFIFSCHRARKNCLVQAPPEHGKTTLIIPSLIWLLHTNQTLKTGIVSKDGDLSTEHLLRIRKALLSGLCLSVFPELVPDYLASSSGSGGEWSKVRLYLHGQTQPAFETYPMMGGNEGHRLDLIWLDDCVTRQCLYSEAERKQSASAIFDTYQNRLTDNGIIICTNNCWHREDAIHQMLASPSYASLWIGYEETERIYWRVSHPPQTWKGPTEGYLPLWDAVWPKKRLENKRGEPGNAWKRLFEGKAITPEDCRFPDRDHWKRWEWSDLDKSGQIVAFLDPAGGKRADKGDFAALILLLRRPDATHDVIDCWVDRKPPEEQIAACFTMHEKWTRLGFGGIFKLDIEMLPKEEGWIGKPFAIHREKLRQARNPYWQLPLHIRNPVEPKEARIEQIGPPLTHGWLRLPEDLDERIKDDVTGPHWRRLAEQLEEWPFNDHDDGPDALSGALSVNKSLEKAIRTDALSGVGIF